MQNKLTRYIYCQTLRFDPESSVKRPDPIRNKCRIFLTIRKLRKMIYVLNFEGQVYNFYEVVVEAMKCYRIRVEIVQESSSRIP